MEEGSDDPLVSGEVMEEGQAEVQQQQQHSQMQCLLMEEITGKGFLEDELMRLLQSSEQEEQEEEGNLLETAETSVIAVEERRRGEEQYTGKGKGKGKGKQAVSTLSVGKVVQGEAPPKGMLVTWHVEEKGKQQQQQPQQQQELRGRGGGDYGPERRVGSTARRCERGISGERRSRDGDREVTSLASGSSLMSEQGSTEEEQSRRFTQSEEMPVGLQTKVQSSPNSLPLPRCSQQHYPR